MEVKDYSFNCFNEFVGDGICESLLKCNSAYKNPIFVCIGSDLVLGDSLGPLVGTLLKKKNLGSYVYGTLNCPITAKEVEYARTYVKKMHPSSTVIAIDAAVGDINEVGLIKVFDYGLKPGLGVNKDLKSTGDISIVGVVSEKSDKNFSLYNLTRLNIVYKMSEMISDGIEKFIKEVILWKHC